VDFKKLNLATKKDRFPLPFIDEVLNTLVTCEAYSLLDGYYWYHHISIALEDRYKTMFVTDPRTFIWKAMFFIMKNGLPTFQKPITKAFKEYLDNFIKILLMISQYIVT
jgi:hypothetical protein